MTVVSLKAHSQVFTLKKIVCCLAVIWRVFFPNLLSLFTGCVYAVLSLFVLTVRDSRKSESGTQLEMLFIAQQFSWPKNIEERTLKLKNYFPCYIFPIENATRLLSHKGKVVTLTFSPHAVHSKQSLNVWSRFTVLHIIIAFKLHLVHSAALIANLHVLMVICCILTLICDIL